MQQVNLNIDESLVGPISRGDEKAFRQLYDLFSPKIYSLSVLYLKSAIAAQDMVQEVFIKLWIKREELVSIQNLEAWIMVVTRNMVLNELKKKVPEPMEILPVAIHNAHPEYKLIQKETANIISRAVNNLSPRQKEVYLLSRTEKLTRQEISMKLGLSPETIKEHMHQALKNIRQQLRSSLKSFLTFF